MGSRKKVILLEASLQKEGLMEALSYAKKHYNWDIHILTQFKNNDYSELLDSEDALILLPDFNKPIDWENNKAEFSKLLQLVRQCEFAANIPLSRAILASERNVGRAFSQHTYYWPERKEAKASMQTNTLPLITIMRMFKFVKDQIELLKPDLFISEHAASPLAIMIQLLSKWRRIPFVIRIESKLCSNRHYWTVDPKMFNTATREIYHSKSKREEPSKRAKDLLKNFRESPKVVAYIQRKFDRGDSKKTLLFSLYILIRKSSINKLLYYLNKCKGTRPKPFVPRFLELLRFPLLKKRQRHLYKNFSEDELQRLEYLYFPMHKEPELILNYQATSWHNQLNTIKLLCANLPAGYRLLVREHHFNLGRRPTRYLKELTSLPNVTLIDARDSQFKYIKHSDLVVTENGSSGWEALMMNKKALILDEVFYEIPEVLNKIGHTSELGSKILELLNSTQDSVDNEKYLLHWIDAEYESTFQDAEFDENEMDEILRLAKFLDKNDQKNVCREEIVAPI